MGRANEEDSQVKEPWSHIIGEKETKSQAEYKAIGLGVKKEKKKNSWIQRYKSIGASPSPGQGISHKYSCPKAFYHITA